MTTQFDIINDEIAHMEELVQLYTHPHMGYDEQYVVAGMKDTLRKLYVERDRLKGCHE